MYKWKLVLKEGYKQKYWKLILNDNDVTHFSMNIFEYKEEAEDVHNANMDIWNNRLKDLYCDQKLFCLERLHGET